MGSGIAQVSAEAGYQVSMRDLEDRFIQGGLNTIKKNLERAINKGKVSREEADRILSKVKGFMELAPAVQEADIVIEAVTEKGREGGLWRDRPPLRKRDNLSLQYLGPFHYRDRLGHPTPPQGDRHAFFQSRPGYEAGGDHPRAIHFRRDFPGH
jgi:hypothetical protein